MPAKSPESTAPAWAWTNSLSGPKPLLPAVPMPNRARGTIASLTCPRKCNVSTFAVHVALQLGEDVACGPDTPPRPDGAHA